MCEQHLDLLPFPTRRHIGVSGGNSARQIAGAFVDGADDLARRHVGRAARPKRAVAAILLTGAITNEAVLADITTGLCEVAVARAQTISSRADIAVIAMIVAEVTAFERAVAADRLVEHRDGWLHVGR